MLKILSGIILLTAIFC